MRRWFLVILSLCLAGTAVFTACRPRFRLPFGLTVNFSGFRGEPVAESLLVQRIRLPEGFSINTFAADLGSARLLQFTPTGDLLVSAARDDKVWLIHRDDDGDGYADGKQELFPKLNQPHGIALHDGWLYVAEGDAVLRQRFDAAARRLDGTVERIIADLPSGGNHWTRTIGIGPDGLLYVAVGSSCNVCIEEDPRRAAISRYQPDGSGGRVYASGLRNSVDFAWQPGSGALYATDNGRDLLGDDFPPCELNRIVDGGFYGWPYANGNNVPDPTYGAQDPAKVASAIAPAHAFGAHTAPLGISFYDGKAFPERFHGAAFVALHGSWNRSEKSGYKVVALFFAADGSIEEEDFLTGFELDNDVIGRPVDTAVGPDGSLYVTDDYAGAVYRVAYRSPARARGAAPSRPIVAGTKVEDLDADERAAAIRRGRQLYDQNPCRSCHEPGSEAYKPITGLSQKYSIEQLATFLRTPQPPMPAFPFRDDERRDLAVFLLATHP